MRTPARPRTPGELAVSRETSRLRREEDPEAPARSLLDVLRRIERRSSESARGQSGRNPGQSVDGESSGGATNTEGACLARAPARAFPPSRGDQSPVAGRPGCLLFLRREESLEVTSGGQLAPRGVQLFAPGAPCRWNPMSVRGMKQGPVRTCGGYASRG